MHSQESPIQYFSEDRDIPNVTSNTTPWLLQIADSYGFTIQGINYIFCSDTYILDINKTYLEHDYYTDIITFDNGDIEGEIESDIFISVDRVAENEKNLDVPRGTEILRVMAHGLLHLCGLKDKSDKDAELMRRAEEDCLLLWRTHSSNN